MSSEFDLDQWDRVSRELRACKESQQQAWGHLDCTTLGRYLAGESTGAEMAEVEQALSELPELRKLTELVRDVLGDLSPVSLSPVEEEPHLLPLASRQPAARPVPRRPLLSGGWRGQSALVAAACLLLVVTTVLPRGGFFSAPAPDVDLANGQASRVPIDRVAERYLAAADTDDKLRGLDSTTVGQVKALVPLAPPVALGGKAGLDRRTKTSGQEWRVTLASSNPAEVKSAVVPALVRALDRASTPAQRRGVVLALGELGPAAVPALPALTRRLTTTSDAEERDAVLLALGGMGPAARRAVPALQSFTPGAAKVVVSKGSIPSPRPAFPKKQCNEATLNRLLATLQAVEGQAGICDDEGCFKVKTLRETVSRLRALARKNKTVVLIETRPACDHQCARLARTRLKEMGTQAVFVIISKKGPTCRVFASESLRQQGFAADKLQRALQRKLQRQPLDDALTAGLDLIVRQVTAK